MQLSTQTKQRTRDIAVFGMLAAIMFLSWFLMQAVPNVHVLGLLIAATTLTYRARPLIPLYVFILLNGAVRGFSLSWLPYLYIWLPLWGVFMLAGRANLPRK